MSISIEENKELAKAQELMAKACHALECAHIRASRIKDLPEDIAEKMERLLDEATSLEMDLKWKV